MKYGYHGAEYESLANRVANEMFGGQGVSGDRDLVVDDDYLGGHEPMDNIAEAELSYGILGFGSKERIAWQRKRIAHLMADPVKNARKIARIEKRLAKRKSRHPEQFGDQRCTDQRNVDTREFDDRW